MTGRGLAALAARLAEAAMRRAAGFDYRLEPVPGDLAGDVEEIVEAIARELAVNREGSLRCGLCGKGPFTRKGLYLHLRRVHWEAVVALAEARLREALLARRRLEARV